MSLSSSETRTGSLTELSGTILEQRYELGRVLGAGGMGAVFEARHLRLDRTVAIKVLRPVFVGHDEYIKRFLREAKSASKIRHRNVVEILDYGEAEGGLVYSVMEFLAGEDLEELLRRQPEARLPWPRVCGLLIQIASGLKAAHAEGVIHRDIKPANCFVTEEEGEPLVKVVDFGIAKVQDAEQTHQLTDTAQVLGTPTYIAPELVRTKQTANARSDVYSLGVLAYRALAGRVPFRGDTVFELLHKACFEPVPPLRDWVPEVPEAVAAFVMQMLAKDPARRPQDMLAVRQRLQALGRETGESSLVELSVSKEIPVAEEGAPRGSVERTTVPRRAAVAKAASSMAMRSELPTNQLERARNAVVTTQPARSPGKVSSAATEKAVVPVGGTAGAVGGTAREPSSMPSRSGETMPALGESTLPVNESAPVERPRARGRLAGAIGGMLLLAGLGATFASGVFDRDGGEVSNAEVQHEDPSSEEAVSEGEAAEPVAVEPADARVETGGEPQEGGTGESNTAVIDVMPDSTGPEPSLPVPRKNESKKPSGPPADGSIIRRLKRQISRDCSALMTEGGVTLSFMIRPSGEIVGLTVSPRDAGGQCAKDRMQGVIFRPRITDKSVSISID